MASTNKTSLGLNKWEASDKPVRKDFVEDNRIIDENLAKLNSDLKAKLIYPVLLSPSEISSLYINASRTGNVVSATITFTVTTAIPTQTYLIIATNFPRPLYALRATETTDDGADKICRLQLENNGKLQIVDSKVATGFYKFTLTYITLD